MSLIIEFKESLATDPRIQDKGFQSAFSDDDYLVLSFDEEEKSSGAVDGEVPEIEISDVIDSEPTEATEAPPKRNVVQIPGATNLVEDPEFEPEVEPEPEPETDWQNDRDPKHFMAYILEQYPNKIPPHDGNSTLGCERAITYLNKLNKEISEALRSDKDDILDIATLENIRIRMMNDVIRLKEHQKKLNKKMQNKKSENESDEIVKEAKSGKFQVVVTPFLRAITGIIVNAVVSSGKQFDDVYAFLKKKYKFTDREELEILQILMDMNFPINKDRGLVGESINPNDKEKAGVEFITTYFA